MSETKRDRSETLAKQKSGNQQSAGTGPHATHRIEQENAASDNKAKGTAGRMKNDET